MTKKLYIIILVAFATNANAQKLTQEEYDANAKYIWQNFVPESGQAAFVQGELLRAVEKLRDELKEMVTGILIKSATENW